MGSTKLLSRYAFINSPFYQWYGNDKHFFSPTLIKLLCYRNKYVLVNSNKLSVDLTGLVWTFFFVQMCSAIDPENRQNTASVF